MTAPRAGLPAWRARGAGLWVGLAVGVPIVAWGVRDSARLAGRVCPGDLLRWSGGLLLAHDLVLVPLVLAVGLGLRRVVPEVAWPPIRWALATTGVLALVGWPYVRGYGRTPANPTVLDRSYGTGIVVAVALTWAAAAAWTAIRVQVRGRGSSS